MITYTHKTHPRSRSLKIRIGPDGEVVVVTPRLVSKRRVNKFIIQNEDWITKQLSKLKIKQSFRETETELIVFGKKHKKENLITPTDNSPEKIASATTRFLKSTAERYITPRVYQLAKKMDLQFNRITLRQQKTRWGSCSRKKNLNFNWRLVHCSPKIIDYVIIHELAHLVHMDHSSRFWNLVKSFDPEYLEHRGWLKRQGLTLG